MWYLTVLLLTVLVVFSACTKEGETAVTSSADSTSEEKAEVAFTQARNKMVDEQIHARNINDSRVLTAMAMVPRHCFVPEDYLFLAYADRPLPIGHG